MNGDDKVELAIMAQNELSRLNRQYRIMEGDRNAFCEEAHLKLAKQRKLIETLQKEHDCLLENVKAASCKINKKKDVELTKILNNLLKEHQKYSQYISSEKSRLSEIISQLKKIDKQIFDLKSKEITETQWQEKVIEGRKIIKNLEDKLNVSVKRYCKVLAENQKLRIDIDHCLKERNQYKYIIEKLNRDLKNGKRFLAELLEQAIIAYEQREEWGLKLHELKHRLQTEEAVHTQEIKELQRKLDRDTKLKEFLSIKGQKRVMSDLEGKENLRKEQQKEREEKQLDLYQETLKKIQEFVGGEKEVNKLVKCYAKQEEENFALFNYVNELNHELEILTESVSELNKNLEEQKALSDKRILHQKENIDVLQTKLKIATKEADEENIKLEHAEKELQDLLEGISNLFDCLNCDISPILNLLDENKSVNDCNVMLFLGLLDKKVAKLTKILLYKEAMMERKARNALNLLKKDRIPFSNLASPRDIWS